MLGFEICFSTLFSCIKEKKIFNKCKDEKNCDFIMYGPGVEKIYEEVSKLFPTSKIEIFSSDYMKKKDHTNSLFNRIRNNQVDILVGTQMISKGFNFPKLNCIVVILSLIHISEPTRPY